MHSYAQVQYVIKIHYTQQPAGGPFCFDPEWIKFLNEWFKWIIQCLSHKWLHLNMHTVPPYYIADKTLCEKSGMSKFTVFIKKVSKLGDLLLLIRFWSMHPMDTLLPHEIMREELYRTYIFNIWKVITCSKEVQYLLRDYVILDAVSHLFRSCMN